MKLIDLARLPSFVSYNETETKTSAQVCNYCNGSGTQIRGMVETDRFGLIEMYDNCVTCSRLGRIETIYKKVFKRSKVEVLC